MLQKKYKLKWLLLGLVFSSFILLQKEKPTLYIIGDSTVENGDGSGGTGHWGWGSFMRSYFDTTKIDVRNHAIGGRSSRTFITEGRWDTILPQLDKGDYVIIQFGHNDEGPLDDTASARGTIKGTGEESKEIYNPVGKTDEVVHSYGWYLRKYIREAKDKDAIPIICSPVPRNQWIEGKIKRANQDYGKWAEETAKAEGARFIDLNGLVADQYDELGREKVSGLFYGDHTHTNKAGAELIAATLINAIKNLRQTPLKDYLIKSK
jgi:lysophospholipase L1-like esterase